MGEHQGIVALIFIYGKCERVEVHALGVCRKTGLNRTVLCILSYRVDHNSTAFHENKPASREEITAWDNPCPKTIRTVLRVPRKAL